MNLTAQLVLAATIDIIVAVAFFAAAYAVLATFLWAWLAALLAAIAAAYGVCRDEVTAAKRVAFDYATTGAAKALDWFAAKRASLTA